MRSAQVLAAAAVASALLLTGCGGGSGEKAKADGGTQDGASNAWFQDAIQGTWSCQKSNHYNGVTVDVFPNTDKTVSKIYDNAQITVEGNNWKATDGEDVNASGTLSVEDSTLTIDMGPLKQVVQGMPTSQEEAANQKAVLVEGADPENRLSISMPSATEINLVDADEYSTKCLKY